MEEYLTKFVDQIIAALPNMLTAILIFIFSLYLAKVLSNLLKRVLLKRNTASGVTHLLADILSWTIIVLGIVTALQRFFNVAAFLAGLGIIGFTIGFALQNIMQNFASGIILLVQQPFKVGDEIQVLEFEGVVLQINIRTTEMQAKDGRIVILPNAEVISHPIVNYTRANRRRVSLPLQISNTANPELVRQLVVDEIKNVVGYVQAPEYQVLFQSLDHEALEVQIYFWVDVSATSVGNAKDQALLKIQNSFKKNKIKLSPKVVYVESARSKYFLRVI